MGIKLAVLSFLLIVFIPFAQAENKSEPHLTQGIEFFQQTKYSKAIESLTIATEMEPSNADAHLFLGLAYSKAGQSEKAVSALQESSRLNPENPVALINLGITQYGLSQFELALRNLEKALKLDPKDPSAHLFSGLCLMGLEQYEKALKFFDNALELDKDFEQIVLFNSGIAHFKNESYEQAKLEFEQLIASKPGSEMVADAEGFLETIRSKKKGKKKWSFYANTGLQHDNNVLLVQQDIFTDEEDLSLFYNAGSGYTLYAEDKHGVVVGYDFYEKLYEDLSQFDFQSHYGYASGWYLGEGGWDSSLSYSYSYSFLDRKDFQASHTLTYKLDFSTQPNWHSTLKYSYNIKNFISSNPRDGNNNSLEYIQLLYFMEKKAFASLSYKFELENTVSSEFDFIGHSTEAKVAVPFPFGITSNLSYSFLYKDYNHLTQSLADERFQARHAFKLLLERPITDSLGAKLEIQHVMSHSNLRASDYNQRTILLGLKYKMK